MHGQPPRLHLPNAPGQRQPGDHGVHEPGAEQERLGVRVDARGGGRDQRGGGKLPRRALHRVHQELAAAGNTARQAPGGGAAGEKAISEFS